MDIISVFDLVKLFIVNRTDYDRSWRYNGCVGAIEAPIILKKGAAHNE